MRLLIIVVTCQLLLSSPASALSWFSSFWQKLDAHELGTWNYLDDLEKPSIRAMKIAILEHDRVTVLRKRGIEASYKKRNILFCTMIRFIGNTYRTNSIGDSKTISYPSTLKWRSYYISLLEDASRKIAKYEDCTKVPHSIVSDIHLLAIKYKLARDGFIKKIEKRSKIHNGRQLSGLLGVEIPGIPLKFEIVNGKPGQSHENLMRYTNGKWPVARAPLDSNLL